MLQDFQTFPYYLIDGVPVRDKDRPGSDVDLLDWLRQCRRAGLYEQGRAIYENGGLNLANLSDSRSKLRTIIGSAYGVAASKRPNRRSASAKSYPTITNRRNLP